MEEKKTSLVENITLTSVPADQRKPWPSIAFIWAGSVICIPALMVGSLISAGMNFKQSALCMNHTVIQTFDRAKRRMYKRYERALEGKALSEKDLTLFEYYEWLQAATKARDACLYGKLSQEEALRIIDVP